ncbi:MAG: metallophosphoesterase [Actinomycetota bacterium]
MLKLRTWLLAATGVGAAVYPFLEARRFGLDRISVPVGSGVPQLDILHISDMHMAENDARLAAFVKGLPEKVGVPDLVLATGDLIEGDRSIDITAESLNSLEARLGRAYVLGSHDYYQARFGNYLKYWSPRRRRQIRAARTNTIRFETLLQEKGWIDLSNDSYTIESPDGVVRLAGVDDPYLRRHRTGHIRRGRNEGVAIGLVHTPDVVSQWALAGFDLVVAGHTHGGQVRLPGIGAVVTNCTLPTGLSVGLNRVGSMWLHVSPGLGTGRFQPIRFNCPPRVTLLSLRPG